MKKLVLTLILILFAGVAAAHHGNGHHTGSEISIVPFEDGVYKFVVAGAEIQSSGEEVIFRNLRPGTYTVEVYLLNTRKPGVRPYWKFADEAKLQVERRSRTVASWSNRYGFHRVYTEALRQPSHEYTHPGHPGGHHGGHHGPIYYPGHPPYHGHPGFHPVPPVQLEMRPDTFRWLISELDSQPFENGKMRVAKSAITSNGISVAQLRIVLDKFSFDNSRLTLAKFALDHTYDPENYFMLSSSFTFSNNAGRLLSYAGYPG